MTTSLTVVIATTGRPTLERTLASLAGQHPDEVLLAVDGRSTRAHRLWAKSGLPGRYLELVDGPHGDWGHTPRNRSLSIIRTSHVTYIDDDDNYVDGAIAVIREAIVRNHDRPILFRMRFPDGRVIWSEKEIVCGNVSTSMIVHPARLHGKWNEARREGDYDFILATCALAEPVWDERVTVHWRH